MGAEPDRRADAVAPRRWVEVVARVLPADVELVAAVLHELAPDGVSIEPVIEVSERDDFVYHEPELPGVVRASLPAPFPAAARRRLRRRLTALPLSASLPPLRYRLLRDEDWAGAYRQHFQLLHVGERLIVRPPWEPYEARAGELVIELDPGHAFGTGQHASTRLALRLIERHCHPGVAVLDLGTGSGILAIAAAKLGAGEVRALDIDPHAVQAARENVRRNGVGGIAVAVGSLAEQWPWSDRPHEGADLAIVNIAWAVIIDLLPELKALLRPRGVLIGSGFSERTADAVEAALTGAGLHVIDSVDEGEWRAVAAQLPEQARGPAGADRA